MSGDRDVFFRIGVMENPQNAAKMDAFNKAILRAVDLQTKGFNSIGEAASSVTGTIDAVVAKLMQIPGEAEKANSSLLSGLREYRAETQKEIVQRIRIERVGDTPGVSAVAEQPAAAVASVPRNVQSALDSVSVAGSLNSQVSEIESSLDRLTQAETVAVDSTEGMTARLKKEYSDRVASQKAAHDKLTSDLDNAVEKQGEAQERMNQSVLKSARAVLDGAKGFAQLGIMSEENATKLVQGLTMIEGAFNIAKGGVEFLEAFSAGWKSVAKANEAANKVTQIQAALAGPQFAQLRTYQTLLAQEAAAANAAALANGRLNASRGVSGAATGAVVNAVSGAGFNAVAGAGASAAGGGFMSGTIGGVAVGTAGTIAAGAAALGAVSLVLVELGEIATGSSSKVGSLTDKIASWEVRMADSVGRFFGADWFGNVAQEKLGAKLQQSTYQNQVSSKLNSINVREDFAKDRIIYDTEVNKGAFNAFTNSGLRGSINGERIGESQSAMATLAVEADLAKLREQGLETTEQYAALMALAEQSAMKTVGHQEKQKSLVVSAKIEENARVQQLTAERLVDSQAKAAKFAAEQSKDSEDYKTAIAEVESYSQRTLELKQQERDLMVEASTVALDSERQRASIIQKEIQDQNGLLDRLKDRQEGAAERFAGLSTIDQIEATNAIKQARAGKVDDLTDRQRDLLKSVGTDEANRFAKQANLSEARKQGFFNEFGIGFEGEQETIRQQTRALEAKLQTSYDISVSLSEDEGKMVDALEGVVKQTLEERDGRLREELGKRFKVEKMDTFRQIEDAEKRKRAAN